ncbi:MAG: hypothetical protein HY907_11700 [Deltaproteobacteria bacterium]|nr:hypothetical protein [Deltaproteobacteria bacterium]
MSPWNGGASRPCASLVVALLALLGTVVPACGDGGADPDDGAADGGDILGDGSETDGGPGDDGGAGAPCEMDFDCAEGQACRDGFCAVTSPDGWCPKLFDRPLRRTILEAAEERGAVSWGAGARCGPRCFAVQVFPEDDTLGTWVLVRQNDGTGVVDTLYDGPGGPVPEAPFMSATIDGAGDVLAVSWLEYYATDFDPRLVMLKMNDGRTETVATIDAAELQRPEDYIDWAYNDVAIGRLQWRDSVLHLLTMTRDDACFGHFQQGSPGGSFERLAAYCLIEPRSGFGQRTGDEMMRPDGRIDLVAGPSETDRTWVRWHDGTQSAPTDPAVELGSGDHPQLCLAPDGTTVASFEDRATYVAQATVVFQWLGTHGAILRQETLSWPTGSRPVGPHHVLHCDPEEMVLFYFSGGYSRSAVVLWHVGDAPDQRDMVDVSRAAWGAEIGVGGIGARHRSETQNQVWYETCGGLRAVTRQRNPDGTGQLVYVEW